MCIISKYTPKIANSSRNFLSRLEHSDDIAPMVALEATVVTGRTYQAHKRGGFMEARERFCEEITGSIFWIWGFKMFSSLGDKVGKKLLGLNEIGFDVVNGNVRKPLDNFVKDHKNISKTNIAAFKCTKVIASILLSNMVIGFFVPKLNQKVTKILQRNAKNKENNNINSQNQQVNIEQNSSSMDKFCNTSNSTSKNNVSFSGLSKKHNATPAFGAGADTLFNIANVFENNATAQLLSNDVGTAGGRAINARNKHERTEVLIRDVGSIYFYMFCRHHINSLFNKFETGRTTRLNPTSAKMFNENILSKAFTEKSPKDGYVSEDFQKVIFGNENATIPESISKHFKNDVITLNKIEELAKTNTSDIPKEVLENARKMADLQPARVLSPELMEDSKDEIGKIITKEQLLNSYKGGIVNNPEMLHSIFKERFNSLDDKYAYVSENKLADIHNQLKDYAKDIINKAKSSDSKITIKTIKNTGRVNFAMNAFNLLFGFGVASYCISTAIPKFQYWVTRKTTGSNDFPGVTTYNDTKKK